MVSADVQKLVAPEGQELSDAIGLVLKDVSFAEHSIGRFGKSRISWGDSLFYDSCLSRFLYSVHAISALLNVWISRILSLNATGPVTYYNYFDLSFLAYWSCGSSKRCQETQGGTPHLEFARPSSQEVCQEVRK